MKTCTIENNTITLNGSVLFSEKNTSFADFSKKALKALQMEYPKFFKMDNLSKLAFLAAEVLLRPFSQSEKNGVALVFANRSASLDTDRKHQATIANSQEYYPQSSGICLHPTQHLFRWDKHTSPTENRKQFFCIR